MIELLDELRPHRRPERPWAARLAAPPAGTLSLAPGAIRPVDYAAEHKLAFWK